MRRRDERDGSTRRCRGLRWLRLRSRRGRLRVGLSSIQARGDTRDATIQRRRMSIEADGQMCVDCLMMQLDFCASQATCRVRYRIRRNMMANVTKLASLFSRHHTEPKPWPKSTSLERVSKPPDPVSCRLPSYRPQWPQWSHGRGSCGLCALLLTSFASNRAVAVSTSSIRLLSFVGTAAPRA